MLFRIDLNKKLNYTLIGKAYRPTLIELRNIYLDSINDSFWSNGGVVYQKFKTHLKNHHYHNQNRKCAYCRKDLEIDADYDHIDHIVNQKSKGNWIFYPKNLVVTCHPCNMRKNADPTLDDYSRKRFPSFSKAFLIFNPHFDTWSDHFYLEDGIFLRAQPNSKGLETIKVCKLNRYQVILNFAKELRLREGKTYKKLTHKIRKSDSSADEIKVFNKALAHIDKIRENR